MCECAPARTASSRQLYATGGTFRRILNASAGKVLNVGVAPKVLGPNSASPEEGKNGRAQKVHLPASAPLSWHLVPP